MAEWQLRVSAVFRTAADRLRIFRFLMLIYIPALVVGVWEFSHRNQTVDLFLGQTPNFANTVGKLYPDRAEPLYMRAVQAGLCGQPRDPVPAACRQFNPRTIRRDVRELFQRGLKTGVKHFQELYYDYVRFLVITGAPKSEIDKAYHIWRSNFPISNLPDPRDVPP